MDEEMEDTIEFTFTVVEIDLDYEFDAARCFDFTREESNDEARESELWFESAGSYPPSPFVRSLILREDMMQETVNTSPKSSNAVAVALLCSEDDIGEGHGSSLMEMGETDCKVMLGGTLGKFQSDSLQKFQNQPKQLPTGLTSYNPMTKDNSKSKLKPSIRPTITRTSTLMKPTASQLAKQNQAHKVADTRSSINPFGVECQAAKRQKLEGGLMHKVRGVRTPLRFDSDADTKTPGFVVPDLKQQNNFVHKASKRDGAVNGNSVHAYLKITIPREPELETAHRAQRTRPNSTIEPGPATTVRRFKALPLNRKILESPSLWHPKRTVPRLPEFHEFHLKTSERAMQHASSIPSSSVSSTNADKVLHKPCTDPIAESTSGEPKRSNFVDVSKQKGYEFVHGFKARPLNKKIFSSKGDIGVFRNSKKETTVPMEFNLQTERRSQHHPPVELFDKLSLAELPPNAVSEGKPPWQFSIPPKGRKENRMGLFQQENEIKHLVKEKPPRILEQRPQRASEGETTRVGSLNGITSKSSGMR